MATRADVDRLSRGLDRLVADAQADIASFFYSWDITEPGEMRDALLEIVPALVREYGDVAATAAAEWYTDLRGQAVDGRFSATLAQPVSPDAVSGSVRWAAGELFGDNPAQTLALLNGAVQRHIAYMGRETVRRNVGQDRSRPRFARVPTGEKTCAWCTLLASRGFAYLSEKSAGDIGAKHNEFHDDCNCQVVPEFDAEQTHIEGYDPDAMYDKYMDAREALAGRGVSAPNDNQVTQMMRRLYPDDFTDGVHGDPDDFVIVPNRPSRPSRGR